MGVVPLQGREFSAVVRPLSGKAQCRGTSAVDPSSAVVRLLAEGAVGLWFAVWNFDIGTGLSGWDSVASPEVGQSHLLTEPSVQWFVRCLGQPSAEVYSLPTHPVEWFVRCPENTQAVVRLPAGTNWRVVEYPPQDPKGRNVRSGRIRTSMVAISRNRAMEAVQKTT